MGNLMQVQLRIQGPRCATEFGATGHLGLFPFLPLAEEKESEGNEDCKEDEGT